MIQKLFWIKSTLSGECSCKVLIPILWISSMLRYPFIDHSSGGSIDGIITGIEKIISIIDNETKIIPGYGLLSNLDELQDYLHMLKVIRQQVETMVKNKKNLEEIIKSDITSDYDRVYSDSFINSGDFLAFVYNDIIHK